MNTPSIINSQLNKLPLAKRNKLRKNTIAYSFLTIPLGLLLVFTIYPLLQGIYISFMDYKILRNPVLGGPIAFIKAFYSHLGSLQNPIVSLLIFLMTIAVISYLIVKKVSKRIIFISLIILLVINIIPLANVFTQTLKEINYYIDREIVLPNNQVERYHTMLQKKFGEMEGTEVIKEKVDAEQSRLYVKRSIWVGLGNYNRMVINNEFADFFKTNRWYQGLLTLFLLSIIGFYVLGRREGTDQTNLKKYFIYLVGALTTILVIVSWRHVFHQRTWLFYDALENSLIYLLVVPPLQLVSILLAVLVNQKIKGITTFRTLYYVPVISGAVIIGYCWRFVYQSNGLLNAFLKTLHILEPDAVVSWLGNYPVALYATMFVTFWRGLGYYMVLYMAGLQGISQDLIEAAKIDGANVYHLITKIYIPLLRPTILVCSVLSTMAALRVFEEVYTLSQGAGGTAPLNGTITMVYLIYDKAFGLRAGLQFGASSATAVILSIIIGLFTIINFKLEGRFK